MGWFALFQNPFQPFLTHTVQPTRKRNRFFRLYHKRRGGRRTGSETARAVGHGLWLASCFTLGVIAEALIVTLFIFPDWRVNHEFLPTTGVARDTFVIEETRGQNVVYRPIVQTEYEVRGTTYSRGAYDVHSTAYSSREKAENALKRFEIGKTIPCWYDSEQPSVVVVVRGHAWWVWLLIWLPAPFMAVGLLGMVFAALDWGRSDEWKSAAATAAAQSPFFQELTGRHEALPSVPRATDLAESPGVRLACRLPGVAAPFWRLFASAMIGILWNVAASICLVEALTRAFRDRFDLLLLAFALLLMSAGAYLAYDVARKIVAAMRAGSTVIEVDSPWLAPGKPTRAYVSQSGHLRLEYIEVWIACEEVAVYRQGTDSRREVRRVFQSRQFHAEGIEIQPSIPYEIDFAILAPADSMHSFRSTHNSVQWSVEVYCKHADGSMTVRAFPLIVAPLQPAMRLDQGRTPMQGQAALGEAA